MAAEVISLADSVRFRDWDGIREVLAEENRSSSRYEYIGESEALKMAIQHPLAPADVVRLLLQVNPLDITFDRAIAYKFFYRAGVNNRRCTPLHVAGLCFPRPDIIDVILEANPNNCLAKDQYGCTPLNVAALRVGGSNLELTNNGRSENVRHFFAAVLAAHPETALTVDFKGNTPLHRVAKWTHYKLWDMSHGVVQALLTAQPDSARMSNGAGRNPFLHAIHFRAPEKIVCAIIKAYPEAVTVYKGRIPLLNLLCQNWFYMEDDKEHSRCYKKALSTPLDAFSQEVVSHMQNLKYRNHGYYNPWLIARCIVRTIHVHVMQNDAGPELHQMLRCPTGCPKLLQRLGYCSLKDQLLMPDRECDLPLHIMARTPPDTTGKNEPFPLVDSTLALCPIDEMASLEPSAANVVDKNGNLPLRLAISSGRGWRTGVRSILKAHPPALIYEDIALGGIAHVLAKVEKEQDLSFMFQVVRETLKIQGCTSHTDPPRSPERTMKVRARDSPETPQKPTKMMRKLMTPP